MNTIAEKLQKDLEQVKSSITSQRRNRVLTTEELSEIAGILEKESGIITEMAETAKSADDKAQHYGNGLGL